MTTRIDSFKLLEKRVRSRFSDYKIRFRMNMGNEHALQKVCQALLTVHNPNTKEYKVYNKSVHDTFQDKNVVHWLKVLSDLGSATPRKILNMLINSCCRNK
eukprot:UN26657